MKSTGLSPVYDDMPDGSPQKTAQKNTVRVTDLTMKHQSA
ncbi:hypothetical protein ECTW10119_3764 [Escherichia coli TW10119]|nr:hypothetical protein ECTW10119_3764 [Escherichia coli TW10119]